MSHSKVVEDIRVDYKSIKHPPKSLQTPIKKAKSSPLAWPKKKAAHKFLNKKTPLHCIQIFPWDDRVHHMTVHRIKILTIIIFVLLVPWHQKTNKAPDSSGEGSRSWSWARPAPEGTIPAGHSSLGRVGTSPNRNQNLPHCTHTQTHAAPWPTPTTSFCSVVLKSPAY